MKKVLFIASMAVFVGLSFGSCKKDHTCTCIIDGDSQTVTYPDTKKKDAKAACDQANTTAKAFDPANSCALD